MCREEGKRGRGEEGKRGRGEHRLGGEEANTGSAAKSTP